MTKYVVIFLMAFAVACGSDDDDKNTNNQAGGCEEVDGEIIDTCPEGQACRFETGDCEETCNFSDRRCADGETCVTDDGTSEGFCETVPQCDPLDVDNCSGGCRVRTGNTLSFDGTTCTEVEASTDVCIGPSPQPCLNGCPGASQVYQVEEGTFIYLYTDQRVVGDEWERPSDEFSEACEGLLTFGGL